MTENPILVTGIARSGTSLIAGVINMCGAFGGRMAVGGSVRRGMFENIRIRETLVKAYLSRTGFDVEGQYPLPQDVAIPMNWKDEVEKAMEAEGYEKGPWMYKDTRMGLMWPVWNYAFPDAKWVIVRRKTTDVVQSCVKTGFMKAFKQVSTRHELGFTTEEEGWLWWIHEHEKRFVEMITEGLNCKVIWPERMVTGNYKQLYELLDWLGLEWKTEVLEFIDSSLWKSRQKKGGDNGSKNDSSRSEADNG